MNAHFRRGAAAVWTCVLFGWQPASATLIERDWRVPGDGLLTFDPSTGLEWLDASQAILDDFPPGDSLEARFQQVVAETAPGGRLEGFRVATTANANQLAESAGLAIGSFNVPLNQGPAANFLALVGTTREAASGYKDLIGVLDETAVHASGRLARNALFVAHDPRPAPIGYGVAALFGGYFLDSAFPNPNTRYAVLLVRIPEASSLALLIAAVAFGFRFSSRVDRAR